MIKGCLFDLDGTLLDTLKSIRYYLNCTLKKYGVRTISEDETKIFVGKGAKNLVERSISAAGIDLSSDEGRELLSKVHPEYVALYDAKPEYLTEPYEGSMALFTFVILLLIVIYHTSHIDYKLILYLL